MINISQLKETLQIWGRNCKNCKPKENWNSMSGPKEVVCNNSNKVSMKEKDFILLLMFSLINP